MHGITGMRRGLRNTALVAAALTLCATVPAYADSTTDTDPNSAPPSSTSLDCGNGVAAVTLTPAAGFDPLTATDDELEANGLPTRPADAADLPTWTGYVTAPRKATACPTESADHTTGGPAVTEDIVTGADGDANPDVDVDTPTLMIDPYSSDDDALGVDSSATGEQHSANWAGNVATGHTYTWAHATWKVPRAYIPADDKEYFSSSWVGIGQGDSKSRPLAQDGSDSDGHNGVYSSYSIWWEMYPQNHAQVVSHDVYFGDTIYSSVKLVTDKAWFSIMDETSHEGGLYTYSSGSFGPDGTAEWIFERPSIDGYYPHLTYATTTFTNAEAQYGSSPVPLGHLTHYFSTMWNCKSASKTRLAYPGAINSAGTSFSTHSQNYGARSKASGCTSW